MIRVVEWTDTDLFSYLDKGLLDFHGVEAVQGVGHPYTAGIAAMLPGNHAQPAVVLAMLLIVAKLMIMIMSMIALYDRESMTLASESLGN